VVVLVGAPYRVFRSTLQGLNQLVVSLSPLSETTYPTGHDTLMKEVDEYLCLINCIAQLMLAIAR
jgi:hypothetical protein